ncbi:MAG: T9SS type A sorting domain-containing protein [Bacteroidia bacterium]|nr:T9SS type A sorting domain-containing protein [Bacteroidia bacterium]
MKKALLLIFTCTTLFSFAQWTPQTSTTTNDIPAVQFINANTGIALAGLTQLNTTNGGQTWTGTSIPDACLSLQMLNSSVGFACGCNADVLKTTNGGVSWTISLNDSNVTLFSVHFPTLQVGYAVGWDMATLFGAVYKTTDGGNSWNSLTNPALDLINDVFFVNADTGWIVGFDGNGDFIYKTIDGGANWITQTPSGNANIYAITCLSPDSCWCVGGYGTQLSRTINGGTTWLPCTNTQSNPLYDVQFVNGTTGYAVGGNGLSSGHIIKTVDGGQTWTLNYSCPYTFLSLDFPSATIGYAVGTGGAIYKYDPSSSINEESSTTSVQLFPNPTDNLLNITCDQKILNLNILSLEGRSIQQEAPGSFTIAIQVSELPEGIYFAEIRTLNGVIRQKFTVQ